ncbi:uncharacterized protein BDZ99DRAFT_542807 [Mytilinidion resinicola]|uniref:Polyketide synthase n=1 Tax=Mytilinidion resinicola TaxID=574789 RepID=A0A6A6Z6U4_9PEZI|nr:uncharacterized protein BDZ99DRAFT_542807 [Mytilinidion resinicola]KAF2816383.1 hypothetical protein BDZ99DRAFT_542807 [Mytilinidion resinicola]
MALSNRNGPVNKNLPYLTHQTPQVNGEQRSNGYPSGLKEIKPEVRNTTDVATNAEPIAVVGFALKFPQQASTPSAFWDLLTRGASARTEVPVDRYNAEAFYRSKTNGPKAGTIRTKYGHFIDEPLDRFDAPFFSITPHEAECMDPQQRWLLETTYHALENAGLSLDHVNGSNTSVYVGSFYNDHETMVHKDIEIPNTYHATGSASSILANRVSWFYNLNGPSVAVNTACSGSLVALHLACQSLRTGETTMGLVCGSNLIFAPENTAGLSNLNFLSPDGKCFAFDERANGYARGEGIASLVIKPLSSAIRDGDTIRAVIRGTGVNSDGRTPGISQPSSEAQISLMRGVYSRFGLDMSRTRYFEAHGTGTAVGDPLEAEAISTVFNQSQQRDSPLYVGALKSNIGHLEGASGLAGVIKTILVLENASIPPNIWFDRVNPAIQEEWGLYFPTRQVPWPGEGLRRASVNSFGFGGTNAHAVIDDAESFLEEHNLQGNVHLRTRKSPIRAVIGTQTSKLLIWSGYDEGGIKRLREAYNSYFQRRTPNEAKEDVEYLENLAGTLSQRRSHLPWRTFSVCNGPKNLRNLDFATAIRVNPKLRVCFVFTGQGAQWPNMGKELMSHVVFRQSLEVSDAVLHEIGCQFSLYDESHTSKSSEIDRPEFCQPLCTAIQIALIELLAHWGIEPFAVVGHSSGEVAAAFCAGIISKTHALELAFFRGVAVAATIQTDLHRGGMIAVRMSPDKCEATLSNAASSRKSKHGALRVACYNSPQNLTLSGDDSEIDRLEQLLQAENIMAKKLNVGIAYHNAEHMQTAANLYRALIQDSHYNKNNADKSRKPRCFFMSSVRGTQFGPESDAAEIAAPDYWVDNLICPVRFTDGMRGLSSLLNIEEAKNDTHFVEIGPHSTLKSAIKENLPMGWNVEKCYSSVLSREQPAIGTALTMAGRLYCLGYPVDVAAVNSNSPKSKPERKVLADLPQYPFDHSRQYWLESRASTGYRNRRFPHNDLLGTPVSDWNPLEAQWNNRIVLEEKAFVKDHKVSGACVYPAAGMLVMAIEAARQLENPKLHPKGYRFENTVFSKSIMVPETNRGVETQFFLRKDEERSHQIATWYDFRLCLYEFGEWAQCCRGSIAVEYRLTDPDSHRRVAEQHTQISQSCRSSVVRGDFYTHLRNSGLDYGPFFQAADQIRWGDGSQGIGDVDIQQWVALSKTGSQSPCLIHPAALDCIIQIAFLGIAQGGQKHIPTLVPTGVKELWISADVSRHNYRDSVVQVSAQSYPNGSRNHTVNYTSLWKDSERPFLVGDLTLTSIGSESPVTKKNEYPVSLYHVDWKPDVNLLSSNSKSSAVLSCQAQPQPQESERVSLTEDTCFLAILEVLEAMGDARLTSPAQPAHYQKHLEWMRHQVNLRQGSDSWKSLLATKKNGPEAREQLWKKVESFGPEGKLIVRLSRVLLPIMRGEVDPLQVLFSDETLPDYYRCENPPPEVQNGIQKYVDWMAHMNPHMKVLEIGAGTGGMTKVVLDALGGKIAELGDEEYGEEARFSEYMFTDISPAFFGAAKKNFGRDGFLCKTLDIDREPRDQGFEVGSYDLVVASNVLHATRCLSTTLNNTRKLLKPGGKLILVEGISPNLMRTSFIFGLLHGWWLSTESFREWGPLVPANKWDELLRKNRFTGTDLVIDGADPASCLSSAIISDACPDQLVNGEKASKPSLVILRTEASTLQDSIASSIQDLAEKAGLQVTITSADSPHGISGSTCLFLQTMDRFSFQNPVEKEFDNLKKVFRDVEELLWVTQRSSSNTDTLEQDAIIGLSRSILSESEGLRTVTLALEDVKNVQRVSQHAWTVLHNYFRTTPAVLTRGYSEEIAEINGSLCVSRLLPAKNLQLHIESKETPLGFDLDTSYNPIVGDDDVEIETKAIGIQSGGSSINWAQISRSPIGREYAGVVTQVGRNAKQLFQIGAKVLALSNTGKVRSRNRFPAYLTHKILDGIDFEEAVAMPFSLIAAYDTLTNCARLRKGESVLVHDGSSALGQAAIQLAVLAGADVFVTVATEQEVNLVYDLCRIPVSHIFCRKASTYSKDIRRLTGGCGVDLVFSSLDSEGLRTSWECVASYGRVVEVGSPNEDASSVGSLPVPKDLKKNVFFARVDLIDLFQDRERITRVFSTVMDMIEKKKIVSLGHPNVYSASQFIDGFQDVDSRMSSCKVVVSFNSENDASTLIASKNLPFDAQATYLITGGLGGLGRSIVKWMVSEGARNLILLSRQGGESENSKSFVDSLKASGISVFAPKCDISDEEVVREVLQQAQERMAPIKGCIQASMVLKSAMFQNLSLDQWNDTLKSKVQGSINLEKHLPTDLDFFIFLSSVCGIIGASGQSNYAFGCAYQDALARYKVAMGKKAVSIDLGIVEGVGYTAEHQGADKFMRSLGMQPIPEDYIHALLAYYCDPSREIKESREAQLVAGIMTEEEMHRKGVVRPKFFSRPLLRHLKRPNHAVEKGPVLQAATTDATPSPATAKPESANTPTHTQSAASKAICGRLSDMIALSIEDIDPDKPLHAFGVDSLVAIEMRSWFKETLQADVPVFDILSNLSIDALAAKAVGGK